nr:MAG TPA: hypothetical protein [Caudoviricetes sp.]
MVRLRPQCGNNTPPSLTPKARACSPASPAR